ncbi:MAG: tetratricopeptide repeat protein [Rivularia sp. (in: Bacteria)]|nr:tetratricopeptide repeat protein [Rivularia sp. MS3]
MQPDNKSQKIPFHQALTKRAVVLFISLFLLSESSAVSAGNYGLKIVQKLETTQQNNTRAEAEKLKNEGIQLFNQGTTESLTKAREKFQAALVLWERLGDKSWQGATLDGIGRIYDDLGELQKALSYYNQALPLLRAVGNKGMEATTLNNIGRVYSDLGEKQKAFSYYNQALPLFRAVSDRNGEATTLASIGLVYNALGEKQKALSYYNQALPILRAVGDRVGEATTLNNIGGVYDALGEKQKALSYYNQALSLDRAVGNRGGEAVTFNNIGRVYSDLGEKQKALFYYNKAISLLRAVGDRRTEAITLNNIGGVYDALGEKQKALSFYNQALPLSRAVGDKGGEATTLSNIGKVYSDLGEKQKALSFYNQALPLLRAVGDRGGEAITLNNIGGVYNSLGEKQKALSFLNQALPLSRAVGDRGGEATKLVNIGEVYSDLGEKQKALSFFNQALPLLRAVGDRGGEATTLNNIGKVYSDLGEPQKVLSLLSQALPLRRAVGDRDGEANSLWNLAYLERKQGNLQASLKHIQDSIQIIEKLRSTYTNQDLKTTYFATVQDNYKFYIDLLMELHKKDPSKGYNAASLNVSERSRARGLLELLTEARADIRKGANPEFLAEESRLQELISAKEKLRYQIVNDNNKSNDPISKAAAQRLEKEVANHLEEYKQLQVKIKQSNPKYANLKYPEPLKLAEIQQQLDKDSLLLQYSLGEERSFLWVVSPDSLDTYELPKKSEIDKSAINLFCLISQSSSKPPSATGKENPCEDTANIKTRRIDVAASELSKLVLAPVKEKLGKKRLVVVADGALQYIPFAALADLSGEGVEGEEGEAGEAGEAGGAGGEKNNSFKKNRKEVPRGGLIPEPKPSQNKFNYQPLLINHEIVNLPSASTIAIQRQELANRKEAPKALAILADPVFSTDDNRVAEARNKQSNQNSLELELERSALKRSADIFNRQGWLRLHGTRTEAETLLQLVPNGDRLNVFDFDANYNWATSDKLNQYRILHFATHGFVNDANPELSGIVLSLVNKQGQNIRGYLRLGDLFNLDYPADLIVLSACETGLGKEIQGEGLVGLTRGLMYAGAERLVVSLWQVSDEGTAVFMQEFYKQMLQNGKSANQALRATQLKMWKDEKWRNPNYWAAFAFLGEWEDKEGGSEGVRE